MTMTSVSAEGRPATEPSVGFGNLVRAEWTKLGSLRSTYWCFALLLLALLGVAVVMGLRWADVLASDPPGKAAGFDAPISILGGVYIGQVVLGAFAVVAISGEYGSGLIRASLSAVPQRRSFLLAKLAVVTGTVLVASEVLCFASFALGDALLGRRGFGVGFGDPGVLRAVSGAGLYLTAVALLGFGLGAVARHPAGALSAFFGVLFAPSGLADLLPTSLRDDVINYMPANAGSQIFTRVPVHGALTPWAGLGIFCCYAAAALVVAFGLIEHRDA